jgi:hypothetical protein
MELERINNAECGPKYGASGTVLLAGKTVHQNSYALF